MDFSPISTVWALLEKSAEILILTEPARMALAEKIKADNLPCVTRVEIIDIQAKNTYEREMNRLTEKDLLILLLTAESYMSKGLGNRFPPFSKPAGFVGKYIFLRLDIPEPALLSGLNTGIGKIEAVIEQCRAFSAGKRVRVTTAKGTDISVKIAGQEQLPYHARDLGGNAFLPPAEISEELVPFSADGVIVADITVGELRFGAELIDSLGLVDQEVRIVVERGLVVDISGGDIARRLKAGLDRLDKGLQMLVELGHGLSDLFPTGIIGVDESMYGTCHFGIGDRRPYHVDVVVSNPHIDIIS